MTKCVNALSRANSFAILLLLPYGTGVPFLPFLLPAPFLSSNVLKRSPCFSGMENVRRDYSYWSVGAVAVMTLRTLKGYMEGDEILH